MVKKSGDLSDLLPEAFSPSRLSDFSNCPAKFFFSTICKLPSLATTATTKGTLAHYAFEKIFDLEREERTEERCIEFVREHWESIKAEDNYVNVVALGPDAVEAMLVAAEQFVHNWFAIEKPWVFDPAGREQWVRGKVGSLPMRGIIDRLDKREVDGVEYWCISDYKGLSLSTELPTPQGWTTMGEVQVGDALYGPSGEVCKVTLKSPVMRRPCYRLFFSSGGHIDCDNVHLWDVRIKDEAGSRREVMDTDTLAHLFEAGSEIEIEGTRALYGEVREDVGGNEKAAVAKHQSGWVTRFLRTSAGQRRLVWSMMFGKMGNQGPVSIRVADEVAARAIADLACGLGGEAGVEAGEDGTWRVWADVSSRVTHVLTGVVPIESVPTQCIQVDSADSLYLASRAMVPTHNTGKVPDPRYKDKAFFGLNVYSVLLEEDQKVKAELLRLVYVTNGLKEDVLTQDVTEATTARTKKMVSDLGKNIRAAAVKGEFRPKTGPLCNYCDYKPICPAYHPELAGLGVDEIRASVGVNLRVVLSPKVENTPGEGPPIAAWADGEEAGVDEFDIVESVEGGGGGEPTLRS
jgi:hypothetical protein